MQRTMCFWMCTIMLVLLVPAGQGAAVGGVQVFPSDHIWNVAAGPLPVDVRSADYVNRIGAEKHLHPDFGSGLWEGKPVGIPYNVVDNSVPKQAVTFDYDDESDPGPYPVPEDPLIEGGGGSEGDRHLLVIQTDEHVLYEIYAAEKQPDGSWHAGSGAVFDLDGYALRPAGWTSADAAGLAILPGLVRYEEVDAGHIDHAIRFTAPSTQRAYIWPARHYASSIADPSYPPMGQRFRLKASFDTSKYPPQARVILEALKEYGMILSDNGGAWFISGVPDERWDNDDLHTLQTVKGSDFEAVDSGSLQIDPDSGQVLTGTLPVVAIPGQAAVPTDPDLDGVYEDTNGNGRTDFADIVVYFGAMDWIAVHEPVAAFDFNGNGRIDFADITALFGEV